MLELVFISLAILATSLFMLFVLAPKSLHNQAWFYAGIALISVLFAGLYLLLGQPQVLLEQQQQIAQQKSNQTVIEALEAKLEKSPDDYEGWLMLAKSYQAIEQPENAAKAYAKLLEIDDSDLDLLWEIGEYAQQLGNFSLAKTAWSKLYQQLPADSDAAKTLQSLLNAIATREKPVKN